MIVVTHIPKTGGISFREYLRQVFGWHLCEDYPRGVRATSKAYWRNQISRLGDWTIFPWSTRCVIGHFLATKYDQKFPDAQHAVWLRDPIQRLLSNYHHWQRIPDPDNPIYRRLVEHKLSLAQFGALPGLRNHHCKMLNGKPLGRFAFVGITEQFELGMQLFARVFDLPMPEQTIWANRNPERHGSRYELGPALLAHLRSIHRQDLELYQEGQERFAELCSAHDIALGKSSKLAA